MTSFSFPPNGLQCLSITCHCSFLSKLILREKWYKTECQLRFLYCNYTESCIFSFFFFFFLFACFLWLGVVKMLFKNLIIRHWMIISLFKNCTWLQCFYTSIDSFKGNIFNKKYCEKTNMSMSLYPQFQRAITFANPIPFIQIHV